MENRPTNESTGTNPTVGNIIPLRQKPNIPRRGSHVGTFAKVEVLEDRILRVDIQLPESDVAGTPFVVSKNYNLAGRGVALLARDLAAWKGEEVLSEQDASFDPSLILTKQVTVDVHNAKRGSKWITTIQSFSPVSASAEAQN